MKKYCFVLVGFALMFASCQQAYYQLVETAFDKDMHQTEQYIVWENEDCKLSYDFWGENGLVKFYFANKTDSIITIDMSKTFFISDGMSNTYFKNRQWGSSGTVYNYGSYITPIVYTTKGGYKYSSSIVSTTTSSATTVVTESLERRELPVISIAPHAAYYVAEFNIRANRITDCDLKEAAWEWKKGNASVVYDEENSPTRFSNYITYQVGNGKRQHIQNNFYVKQVTNLLESNMVEYRTQEECGVKKSGYTERVLIFPVENFSNAFYFKYMR